MKLGMSPSSAESDNFIQDPQGPMLIAMSKSTGTSIQSISGHYTTTLYLENYKTTWRKLKLNSLSSVQIYFFLDSTIKTIDNGKIFNLLKRCVAF